MDKWRNLVIALAGITQAVDLVDKLAKTGYLDSEDFKTAVQSLFAQNPPTTEAVFGNATNLLRGYEVLIDLLQRNKGPQQTALISYCLGVVHLQKRLLRNRAMLNQIAERLDQCRHQMQHFGITHENVIANIASIYTETISTFPFRIQVVGEYQYLQQSRIANQVRVLLLCAIRAAILWRQLGGTRWHFLFQRGQLIKTAEQLLEEAKRARLEISNS
ncbi:lysogenization regulator HflD [Saccharophagus sp. K07]|uniref:high frequency lysogenization protein HflD n=1 Tax=Saccharophagus sp. K07 TaxID=2283636 RepID=UPI001651C67D|nr:high frequency lysogenization protein HflD [Saccharophagus sp. K07]MBC6904903.1 lysogenization regulator HflD [Saccharophagus sp. K07]